MFSLLLAIRFFNGATVGFARRPNFRRKFAMCALNVLSVSHQTVTMPLSAAMYATKTRHRRCLTITSDVYSHTPSFASLTIVSQPAYTHNRSSPRSLFSRITCENQMLYTFRRAKSERREKDTQRTRKKGEEWKGEWQGTSEIELSGRSWDREKQKSAQGKKGRDF